MPPQICAEARPGPKERGPKKRWPEPLGTGPRVWPRLPERFVVLQSQGPSGGPGGGKPAFPPAPGRGAGVAAADGKLASATAFLRDGSHGRAGLWEGGLLGPPPTKIWRKMELRGQEQRGDSCSSNLKPRQRLGGPPPGAHASPPRSFCTPQGFPGIETSNENSRLRVGLAY